MNKLRVVFDSPRKFDYLIIRKYIKREIPVSIVEPFHAYHHKKGIRFFPPHLPLCLENFISKGEISILKAKDIQAEEIYLLAADKAVRVTESIYPAYRKNFEEIFVYVSDTLRSTISENVFKYTLCNKLAEFYSVNFLLHRIEKHFNSEQIVAYPDTNLYSYHFIKRLLTESEEDFFEHPNIKFPIKVSINSFLENLKQNIISLSKLCVQTMASGFWGKTHNPTENKKKNYPYGMTIIGPRQLRDNKRGPDFIIDNKKINANEVVYFPLMPMTTDQQKTLAKLPGEIHFLPKQRQFFSNFSQWKRLLLLGVKYKFLRNDEELMTASNVFLNYFRWQKVMEDVSIRQFITHADFGVGHIGRNLALNQAGVKTWYFTDSMNHTVNFQIKEKHGGLHPFWTYLYYDHLVTWDDTLVQYYREHPGSFKNTQIVGCLWSEHIQEKYQAIKKAKVTASKNLDNFFVLSSFDSTYSRNGFTSYAEGLTFAKHLLELVDEYPDIYLVLKEKKDRDIHFTLDPVSGPKLIEIYDKMDLHPRIKICSNDADASELISLSDMVISFPFTSTTFEALSTDKPAIWHDPEGYYSDTLYGKAGQVVTHNYGELKNKVLEIKDRSPGQYRNPMSIDSPLMDPYRDRKAIDRFRDLLTSQ